MVDRVAGPTTAPRRRSALRRLGDVLAPDGPTAGADPADDVLRLAEAHQLLPAVRSATGTGRDDVLRTPHLRNLARNMALVAQVTELLTAFDEADIPAAPLKGIDAVLTGLYPDEGARTMADLDVLVAPSAGPAAEALLARLGYEPADDELPDHHHLTPMALPGRVGMVEVHIGLQDRRSPAFIDAGQVLARATRVPGRPGLRLDRTDAATHLVDHAQHATPRHRAQVDVRSLHETALVIRRVPEVDWPEVRARFAGAGIVERLDAHLTLAAELFAVDPPVALGRAGRWVARRELFLADHAWVALLDRPGDRFAKLRRERLERYYRTALPGAAVWRARARYLGEVVAHRRPPDSAEPDEAEVAVTPPP